VRRLSEVHDHLTADELKPGFMFQGERIPLINPQRSIFKPQPHAAPQGVALLCKQRYASEAMSMSDQDDWEFAGPDDAKAEIRAAVGYLLRGATGGARGDIVQEIIAIVRQVASGLPPE